MSADEPMTLHDVVTSPSSRAQREASGAWDRSTLWTEFSRRAALDPDALAVVDRDGERRATRGRLLADASALAARFEADGLVAGQVISVQLPNRYETVVVALAALRLGLVVNTLLPNYRAKELDHIFRTATPRAVVTPAEHRGHDHVAMIDALAPALPPGVRRFVVDDDERLLTDIRAAAATGAQPSTPLPSADAVSELIFSSGTEATPKGVMHTEQTTNAGVRAVHTFLGLGRDDVVWMPSPVGHSTGFNFGLRFALYHGLPLVLQDRWDPVVAIDLVHRFGATYTLAATTFLQDLVDELVRRDDRLDGLDKFACGGAPVPPELVLAAAERGIGVLRLYGSTEALVVTCNRSDLPREARLHTDGVALPGVELRTRDDDGRLCASGAPGEIEVRTPQGAVGYFADAARTAATFTEGGWIRSGDLGVLGDDGSLSIVGRKKEIIIRGGLNIAPREIEEMLLALDEVERCAVIGLPDDRLGEKVCACVHLRAGATLTLDAMVDRLRAAGLATYKLPQVLEVVDELPTTASGKIQKHVLVERLA
jgi:acyl-CoA synthetase (AMP-forming)/AMP-acid ligase II